MSANKSVNVLAPNGRRQNVKVSPNSTILQILEEVCKKQGFKPEEYDLRHHNHVLDTTAIMRFSGLPNNAQLEMATAVKVREETSVTLGLQLESGDRLMGNFLPTVSLWDVIRNLCPDEADPDSNPVIIYMRREVSGVKPLQETTLRSLGLTSGRAMLRYMHCTAEQLHRQANVSAPLLQRTVTIDAPPEHPSGSSSKAESNVSSCSRLNNSPCEAMEVDEPPVTRKPATEQPVIRKPVAATNVVSHKVEVSAPPVAASQVESVSSMSVDSSSLASTSSECYATVPAPVPATNPKEEEIVLLGERNAIVFSQAMAQSVPYEDLPEDFYDLTVEDARAIYRDIKAARSSLEDAPLATSALRQLEDSKRILNQLGSYKRAVLRIQFPDQTVLQGTFLPFETVAEVKEFVKKYLHNPDARFHLFTTPPKMILPTETRLVEANCVPSALLHFGLDTDQSGAKYLREELLSRLTSPSAAALAACQSRGLVPSSRPCSAPPLGSCPVPSTSGTDRAASSSRRAPPRQDIGPLTKVPKWFKPSK